MSEKKVPKQPVICTVVSFLAKGCADRELDQAAEAKRKLKKEYQDLSGSCNIPPIPGKVPWECEWFSCDIFIRVVKIFLLDKSRSLFFSLCCCCCTRWWASALPKTGSDFREDWRHPETRFKKQKHKPWLLPPLLPTRFIFVTCRKAYLKERLKFSYLCVVYRSGKRLWPMGKGLRLEFRVVL